MRILALDFGSVRCGLALSDPTGSLASPLPFLPASNLAKLVRAVAEVAKAKQAELLLLGLPRHMNGQLGAAAAEVQAFAELLKRAIPLPLRLIDERLSTVQASRQLHEAGRNTREQRSRIDSMAATVLLQGYLDAQPGPPPPL